MSFLQKSSNDSGSVVICKNDLILVPAELVPTILEQLHEGHVGRHKNEANASSLCILARVQQRH